MHRLAVVVTAGVVATAVLVAIISFTLAHELAVRQPVAISMAAKVAEAEPPNGRVTSPSMSVQVRPETLTGPAVAGLQQESADALLTSEGANTAAKSRPACENLDALGVSRVVEIDTAGGPGFGFEQFKAYDFLREHEVVLTFDDGPWPGNTLAALKALADQCTKALFFPIGKHTMWHPEILKRVAAAGHTIGSHTWSHADLSKLTIDQAKDEFEKGVSAVRAALGEPGAPFFRFPGLRDPPEVINYLGTRNIGIFSTDIDSFDFKIRKPEQVVTSVMTKLNKRGKGIILLHDFQHPTSLALPALLAQLKANGFKIVQVKAKDQVKTLPQYDEAMMKEFGGSTVGARPTSSVVHTISE